MVENSEITAGQLVLVATPLGNLGDISRRALELLESATVLYCEDTRRSSTLFQRPQNRGQRTTARDCTNTTKRRLCDQVVAQVASGQTVVVISDAGTPGISDPGARVAAAVADAGLLSRPPPDRRASWRRFTISGLSTERFAIGGLRAAKVGRTAKALYAQWMHEPRTNRLLRVAPAPRGHTE